MAVARRSILGFTVIEMMVSVAVGLVLLALALPSFEGLRLRSAIRGAGEQTLGFWNQARLETAKRNELVKVGVFQSAAGFCLGAATIVDPDNLDDEEVCDCFETDDTQPAYCDVARFPGAGNQAEWKGVSLAGVTLGGGTDLASIEPALIEPKRTGLLVGTDDGTITLLGPPGHFSYRLNLHVDRFGRAKLCESTTAINHLPDYGSRKCPD